VKLFGLDASKELAQSLTDRLGVWLASHEERDFEDGEFKVRPLESVRGEHVFICQSLASAAPRTVLLSPDAGGVKRARVLAALLEARSGKPAGLAFMERHAAKDASRASCSPAMSTARS
jgi:ribose-phosphate pyrophosphokinase